MPKISSAKVVILATHGFEQSELMVPRRRLQEAGAQVVVVSPQLGQIRGWKDQDWGESVTVDKSLQEVSVDDFDAVVLPGGQINPDLLRVNAQALKLIREFIDAGKVVAAICHAPWLLVEVDAVRDRQVTSYESIKTDVINAHKELIEKTSIGKGVIRYTNLSKIDFDLIRKMLAATYTSKNSICD